MGWTTTTWTNADWSLLANVNDFVNAIRERHKAITNGDEPPGISTKNVGDDVQDAAFWRSLQEWVEDYYGYFVISHDNGVPRSAAHFEGETTIPVYGSLADVFSAAGLGTTTWRAYTTHPDDGGADQARKIQAGDIIGPWLFEDLQKVLNVLVWTKPAAEWTAAEYASGVGGDWTWADAKAAAEADWGYEGTGGGAPGAVSYGYLYGGFYNASLNRTRGKGTLSNDLWTGAKRDVDWYVYATKPAANHEEWDTNGDGVQENQWACWQTDTATTDARPVSTSYLGQITDKPAWVSEPTVAGETYRRGWASSADSPAAVVRWNVTDGFTYQ